jgi:hypothetical protein
MFWRNIGELLTDCTALHLKRKYSIYATISYKYVWGGWVGRYKHLKTRNDRMILQVLYYYGTVLSVAAL